MYEFLNSLMVIIWMTVNYLSSHKRHTIVTQVLVEGYKLTAVRGTSSGGPMYSILAAVNNTALYTRKLLTEPISDFSSAVRFVR